MRLRKTREIRLSQDRETAPRTFRVGPAHLTFASHRSREAVEEECCGQDYVAISLDGACCTFVVCDGVSQSFFGDLAARLVGDHLANWLRNEAFPRLTADALRESLLAHFQIAATRHNQVVQEFVIPDTVSEIHQNVLESQRRSGSQSMFLGGRIDLPSRQRPKGRALLVWLGDVRLRAWALREEWPILESRFQTRYRWSTKDGFLGAPPFILDLPVDRHGFGVTELFAYTDGLTQRPDRPLAAGDFRRLWRSGYACPHSDDLSFVHFRLDGTRKHRK